ncbi:hypothetical protein [Corallococcus sp. M7]
MFQNDHVAKAQNHSSLTVGASSSKPRNAFQPVTATTFNVTNNTGGALGNQYILVFLTPLMNSANYVYAAWQQLNPGEGATQPFVLNQNITASVTSPNGTTSAQVSISPGYLSQATNPRGLSPVLGAPQQSSSVTPQQSGVQNFTNPFIPLTSNWYVNGNLVVSSSTQLTGGAFSAFELQTTLYWAIGNTSTGANYTLNQITPLQSYSLPAGTAAVNVSVTYNSTTGLYGFDFGAP